MLAVPAVNVVAPFEVSVVNAPELLVIVPIGEDCKLPVVKMPLTCKLLLIIALLEVRFPTEIILVPTFKDVPTEAEPDTFNNPPA